MVLVSPLSSRIFFTRSVDSALFLDPIRAQKVMKLTVKTASVSFLGTQLSSRLCLLDSFSNKALSSLLRGSPLQASAVPSSPIASTRDPPASFVRNVWKPPRLQLLVALPTTERFSMCKSGGVGSLSSGKGTGSHCPLNLFSPSLLLPHALMLQVQRGMSPWPSLSSF